MTLFYVIMTPIKEANFLSNYIFYFVSLSDGDSSLRVRYISAFTDTNLKISTGARQKETSAPFSSLYFIMNGKGSYNGKTIGKGYAFLMTNDSCSTFSSDDPNCLLMQIAFNGTHTKKLLNDLKLFNLCYDNAVTVSSFNKLDMLYNELVSKFVKNVPLDPAQILSQISAKSYFYSMLSCLENHQIAQLDTNRRKLLVMAEEYMLSNFSQCISVDDVANHLHIDRRYLYKIFKQHSGISPKGYLNNIRISKACELLASDLYSVSDIAKNVGYSDQFQFSKFFKKQTGISPIEYKKSASK